jgi:hypothetical protein
VSYVHTFRTGILEGRMSQNHDRHSGNYQSYLEVSGGTEYRRPRCQSGNEVVREKYWWTLGERCQQRRVSRV